MANLTSTPSADFVVSQVDVRQKSLGKFNRSIQDLQYYNSKTSWMRLASSVDLTADSKCAKELKNLGFNLNDYLEEKLAKSFILFGGVNTFNGGLSGFKTGINTSGKGLNANSAYGFLSPDNIQPLPSFDSVDISYLNRGTLQKATIKIKAYTREQFAVIDYLYMRPGYSILVEYGHTLYLDDKSVLKQFPTYNTNTLTNFFNNKNNHHTVINSINKEIETYKCNYNAFLGKITKYSWNFNPAGHYEITINASGYGDIIDSLRMNHSATNKPNQTNTTQPQPDEEKQELGPSITTDRFLTTINEELYKLHELIASGGKGPQNIEFIDLKDVPLVEEGKLAIKTIRFKNAGFLSAPTFLKATRHKDLQQTGIIYVKLAYILALIQKYSILLSKDKSGQLTSYLTFDINFENLDADENYVYIHPAYKSVDLRKCIVNGIGQINTNAIIEGGFFQSNEEVAGFTGNANILSQTEFKVEGEPHLGKLSNMYVSISHVTDIIRSLISSNASDNTFSITDFIQKLMDSISKACGGTNKFKVVTNETKIIITEDAPLTKTNVTEKENQYAKFVLYGVREGKGNFVKSLNVSSEISNDFATMVTVGAQASGNIDNISATTFSNFNAGLTDRIIKEKLPPLANKTKEQLASDEEQKKSNELDFKNKTDEYNKLLKEYGELDNEAIDNLVNLHSDICKYSLNQATQEVGGKSKQPAPFFIPVKLSMDLDGISGFRINERISIDNNILPPAYDNSSVDFLIIALSHTISNNEWNTKIDTTCIPVFNKA